jgi:hypothetical protein
MRMILLAASLALAAATLPAAAQDIGGRYEVRGTNFDGSRYGGEAVIRITSDTTCEIVWNTGGTAEGICMRSGNALAAGYTMGGEVGLVIYRILPDGRLDGVWTIAGQDGHGTELLVPR